LADDECVLPTRNQIPDLHVDTLPIPTAFRMVVGSLHLPPEQRKPVEEDARTST